MDKENIKSKSKIISLLFAVTFLLISIIRLVENEILTGILLLVGSICFSIIYYSIKKTDKS